MLYLMTETAHHATHAAAGAAEHAEGASHGAPHVSSWIQLLAKSMAPSGFSDFLTLWEKSIFSFIVVGIIAFFCITITRGAKKVPTRGQLLLESIVTGLNGLVTGVLGPTGSRYTPFVGSLFIYIFVSNMLGLVPLQNSTMSFITTTAPIAISVFLYVQWIGITQNGLLGYFNHLAGSPKDAFGWALVPLNLPLHVLGEFIKPLSLSFRLYGNIMAGHMLLAVFVTLGVGMLKPLHIPVGVPLHLPFLFLEIMVGAIQAFVFTLLSTVYIAMMLPHEDHGEEHGHEPHAPGHESAGHVQSHL